MTLADRIRECRTRAGLSQAELARRCGIKPPSINNLESGKSKGLRGVNLLRMAEALGCSPEWLAGDAGAAGPEDGGGDNAPVRLRLDEARILMAITCLETEIGDKFSKLAAAQKAKLIAYLYYRGEQLTKAELVPLLGLL